MNIKNTNHLSLRGIATLLFSMLLPIALFAQTPLATEYLTVDYPTLGQRINTSTINVRGTVSLEAGEVLLNNESLTINEDGTFSYPMTLSDVGENQITFQIFNKKKLFLQPVLLEEVTLFFTYSPEKKGIKPELIIHSPVEDLKTPKNLILFKGEAKHAVQVLLNDSPIQLDQNGKFYVKRTLSVADKPQIFEIKALSKDGLSTTEVRRVTYTPKRLPKAVITLTEPNNNAFIYKNQVSIKGTVENAAYLWINDVPIPVAKDGSFHHKEALFKMDQYHTFTITAATKDNQKTTETRRIFYAKKKEEAPKPKPKPTPKPKAVKADPIPEPSVKATPIASKEMPSHISDKLKKRLNKTISLELEGAELKDVLKIISKKSGLNIVSDNSLRGNVNILLTDTSIKDAIDYLLDTQGLSYRIVDNTILIASGRKLDSPTQLSSSIVKLNNASAKTLSDILQKYLSRDESIQFSEKDNLLIMHADKRKLATLQTLISSLDSHEEPQVFLEVQVIETSTSALRSRGIAWPGSIGLGFEANITNENTTIQSNPSFQALIQALESEGDAKILARPRLKAVNNDEAEIFIGERVPIVQTTVDTTGRVTETVSFVDTGILLKVQPSINSNTGEIKLRIRPEISVISGFRGTNADKPVIRTRKVNTSVWIKDGETVVIGGLFNSSDTKNVSRVPLLGNVPILGNLFSSSKKEKTNTELLITVTPKIVGRTEVYFSPKASIQSE